MFLLFQGKAYDEKLAPNAEKLASLRLEASAGNASDRKQKLLPFMVKIEASEEETIKGKRSEESLNESPETFEFDHSDFEYSEDAKEKQLAAMEAKKRVEDFLAAKAARRLRKSADVVESKKFRDETQLKQFAQERKKNAAAREAKRARLAAWVTRFYASRVIQASIRRFLVHKKFVSMKRVAVQLQGAFRMFLVQKKAAALSHALAVEIAAEAFRLSRERDLKQFRRAQEEDKTVAIKAEPGSCFGIVRARTEAIERKCEKQGGGGNLIFPQLSKKRDMLAKHAGSRVVQTSLRCFLLHKKFVAMKRAAIQLQCVFRMLLVQKKAAELREMRCINSAGKDDKVLMIEAGNCTGNVLGKVRAINHTCDEQGGSGNLRWKDDLSPQQQWAVEVKQRVERRRRAVLTIQSIARSFLVRRRVSKSRSKARFNINVLRLANGVVCALLDHLSW